VGGFWKGQKQTNRNARIVTRHRSAGLGRNVNEVTNAKALFLRNLFLDDGNIAPGGPDKNTLGRFTVKSALRSCVGGAGIGGVWGAGLSLPWRFGHNAHVKLAEKKKRKKRKI